MFVSMFDWIAGEDIADYAPCVKKLKHKHTIEVFRLWWRTNFFIFGSNDLILRTYEKGNQLNKE